MQCSKCSAAKMKLDSERDFIGVYRIRQWRCERCGNREKQLLALASHDTRLMLASSMKCPQEMKSTS